MSCSGGWDRERSTPRGAVFPFSPAPWPGSSPQPRRADRRRRRGRRHAAVRGQPPLRRGRSRPPGRAASPRASRPRLGHLRSLTRRGRAPQPCLASSRLAPRRSPGRMIVRVSALHRSPSAAAPYWGVLDGLGSWGRLGGRSVRRAPQLGCAERASCGLGPECGGRFLRWEPPFDLSARRRSLEGDRRDGSGVSKPRRKQHGIHGYQPSLRGNKV